MSALDAGCFEIETTPRIGITKSAELPLRFLIRGNAFVSQNGDQMAREIWLIRHGETAWSLSGAHTGRTDLPLTETGERQAVHLRSLLAGHAFDLVLTSPLQRARRTCELAGLGGEAIVEPNLVEWDYGCLRRQKYPANSIGPA